MTTILIISLLVGVVAAGFTWFTWDLLENVGALMSRRGKDSAEDAPAEEPEPGDEA